MSAFARSRHLFRVPWSRPLPEELAAPLSALAPARVAIVAVTRRRALELGRARWGRGAAARMRLGSVAHLARRLWQDAPAPGRLIGPDELELRVRRRLAAAAGRTDDDRDGAAAPDDRAAAAAELARAAPGALRALLREAAVLRRSLLADAPPHARADRWRAAFDDWQRRFHPQMSAAARALLGAVLEHAAAALGDDPSGPLWDDADLQRALAGREFADATETFLVVDSVTQLSPLVRRWLGPLLCAAGGVLVLVPAASTDAPDWFPRPDAPLAAAADWYEQTLGARFAPLGEEAPYWAPRRARLFAPPMAGVAPPPAAAASAPPGTAGAHPPPQPVSPPAPPPRGEGVSPGAAGRPAAAATTDASAPDADLDGPDGMTLSPGLTDEAEELRWALERLSRGLREEGWDPGEVLLLLGDAERYAPALEGELARRAIPFESAWGRPLAAVGLGAVVLEHLELLRRGPDPRLVFRLWRAPLFPRACWNRGRPVDVQALEELAREAIVAPDPRWYAEQDNDGALCPGGASWGAPLAAALRRREEEAGTDDDPPAPGAPARRSAPAPHAGSGAARAALGAVLAWLKALAPAAAAATRREFLARLGAYLRRLGLPARLARPARQWAADETGGRRALIELELGYGFAAWAEVRRTLDALAALPDEPGAAAEFAAEAAEALGALRLTTRLDRRAAGAAHRVLVAELLEGRRLERPRVLVLGLGEGKLPVPTRGRLALPPWEERAGPRAGGTAAWDDPAVDPTWYDEADPLAQAGLLTLDLLAKGARTLWLSHPAGTAAEPRLPALTLAPLWRRWNAQPAPARQCDQRARAARLFDGRPRTRAALLAALADALAAGRALPAALAALVGPRPGRERRAALSLALGALQTAWRRRAPVPAGAEEGVLAGRGGERPALASATRLEAYADCPMLYFLRHRLAVERRAAYEEELDRFERGTMLHAVVARFFGAVRDELPDELRPAPTPWPLPRRPAVLCRPGEDPLPAARDRWLRARLWGIARAAMAAQPFDDTVFLADCLRRLRGLAEPEELAGEDRDFHHRLADTFGVRALAARGFFRVWYDHECAHQRRTGLYPVLEEAVFGAPDAAGAPRPAFAAADGTPVMLRGALDRLDARVEADGRVRLVSLDYKTSRAPGRALITAGRRLQLPLYLRAGAALLAREAAGGGTALPVRPEPVEGPAPDLIRGRTARREARPPAAGGLALPPALPAGEGLRFEALGMSYVLLSARDGRENLESLLGPRAELVEVGLLRPRQGANLPDRAGFETLIGAGLEETLAALETGIAQGWFAPATADPGALCSECEYRPLCRVRPEKAAQLAAHDPRAAARGGAGPEG